MQTDINYLEQRNIDEVEVARRAASNTAAALSALCGGSGVGQAPELPHRAERLQLGSADLPLQKSSGLPQLRVTIHADKTADFRGSDQRGYKFSVGNGRDHSSVPPAAGLGNARERSLRKKQNLRIRASIVRCFESSNSYIRQRIIDGIGKIIVPKELSAKEIFRFALSRASYLLIFLAFAGFCFTYGPVLNAEIRYHAKNFKFQISNFKIISKFQISKTKENIRVDPQAIRVNSKMSKLPETGIDEKLQKELAGINFPADMSIVIPKIDASAEFIPNVDPGNYDEYMSALRQGVAHAKGTALPGMIGNSYFFAHSAGNLFDIARFNAVFYLIGKLEKGDPIYVKFGNQKFKYTVIGKREVAPSETQFLTHDLGKLGDFGNLGGIEKIGAGDRVLTLQTCVPPGTDWRRLLVFAKIED